MERRLIGEYEETITSILDALTPANHAAAIEIARLPLTIRGFGHIKEFAMARAADREAELMRLFRDPAERRKAAVKEAAE